MPPDQPPLLDLAPEVVRVLGAAGVMQLRADPALDEYVCCICDEPGRARAGSGAAVVAVRYTDGATLARLAHPDCSPSTLLTVIGRPSLRSHTVRALAALTATGHPLLRLTDDVRAWPATGARLVPDHRTRALTAAGFTPLTAHDDVTSAGPHPAGAPGLTVTLARPRAPQPAPGPADATHVRVEAGGRMLFDGLIQPPAGWRRAVRHRRRLVVITGPSGSPDDRLLTATAHLAGAGIPLFRRFRRVAS